MIATHRASYHHNTPHCGTDMLIADDIYPLNIRVTRMHSSRMRTVRSSGRISGRGVPGPGGVYLLLGGCTCSRRGCTWSGGTWLGVPGPRGVPGPGGYLVPGGVPGPGGAPGPRGVYLVRYPPPVDRHTPVKT